TRHIGDQEAPGRVASGYGEMRKRQLDFAAQAGCILLWRRSGWGGGGGGGGGGAGVDVSAERLRNGEQGPARRGGLLDLNHARAIGLSGIEKHRLGEDGEASVVTQRH